MFNKTFKKDFFKLFQPKEVDVKDYLGDKPFNMLLKVIDEGYNNYSEPVTENDIQLFLVKRTEKTEKFYEELKENEIDETLYLIYDKKHNYMTSNSNRFFLEMWLLKGLDVDEVVEKPYLLTDYVLKVRSYLGYLE